MRTTVTLDDELLKDAVEFTGIKEKSLLVNAGAEGRWWSGKRRAEPPPWAARCQDSKRRLAKGPGLSLAGGDRRSRDPR